MTLVPTAPAQGSTQRVHGRETADAAGRRLAAQTADPSATTRDNPVEAMARAAIPRLREIGVVAEIVRVRRDCLVVRSVAADPLALDEACALVGGWLAALPEVACGLAGTVAESTCATRGQRMCMHTLMWTEPAGGSAAATRLLSARRASVGAPTPTAPTPTKSTSTKSTPTGEPRSTPRVLPAGPVLPGPLPDAASPLPIPAASGLAPAVPLGRLASSLGWQTGASAPVSPVPPGAPGRDATTRTAPDPTSATGPGATTYAVTPHGAVRAPVRRPPLRAPGGVTSELRVLRAQGARARIGRRPAPFGRAPWVRRRAWLLVLGLLAGLLGGLFAASQGGSSYAATAVLEVEASTATSAVSSANGAEELAVTYAALIPTDEALLAQVGADIGSTAARVGHSLSVEAVSGTALIDVRFSTRAPAAAVEGANRVADALTAGVPPGKAITPGSVSLVSTAEKAARQGSLRKYGLPIGLLLGLLVGAGAALVAERTDRRVDDVDGLSAAAGCSATSEPGGITPGELASALSATGEPHVVFLPLGAEEEQASASLGMRVARAWRDRPAATGPGGASGTGKRGGSQEGTGDEGSAVTVSAPFSRSPQLSARGASTVLVVAAGQRASTVQEAAERLRLLCQGPTWAVLVPGAGRAAEDIGA